MQLKKKFKETFYKSYSLRTTENCWWQMLENRGIGIFFPLELNELLPPAQDSNFGASVIIKSYRAFICLLMYEFNFSYRFVNALVYYGVFLSAPTIGGNFYLNFFLTSLVELPAIPVGIWFFNRYVK